MSADEPERDGAPPSPFVVPGLGELSRMIGLGELAALAGRAASLVSSLPPPEANDARRVLAIVQEIALGFTGLPAARSEPGPPSVVVVAEVRDETAEPAPARQDAGVLLRIELRGLAERLGRRSADGIPFASLARAASAELHGSLSDAFRIRAECDGQLLMHGL